MKLPKLFNKGTALLALIAVLSYTGYRAVSTVQTLNREISERQAAQKYQLTIMSADMTGALVPNFQFIVDRVGYGAGGELCFHLVQADAVDCFKAPIYELAPINQ